MIKNKFRVNNPLTVIAIFSMLTEASAAVSLPYIDRENQKIYVWFLIVFPSILITLFFLTLNFKNKTLYTPMDFAKEKHRETPYLSDSEAEDTLNKNVKKPCAVSPVTTSLLSKPGIRLISYSPKNFIFLPQGHRHYDSGLKKTTSPPSDPEQGKHHISLNDDELSSLYLIDFSHPSLRLSCDHTLEDILQTYYESAHPKKESLHKKDVLLLLTSSPLQTQGCSQQRFELNSRIASHLGEATVIAYNTETRQLNTLN
ncbi:hypothetical protein SB766_15455 [Pseudomonas sp. SIMBA_077]